MNAVAGCQFEIKYIPSAVTFLDNGAALVMVHELLPVIWGSWYYPSVPPKHLDRMRENRAASMPLINLKCTALCTYKILHTSGSFQRV